MQVWAATYAEMVHAFVAANPQFNSLKADLEAAVEFHDKIPLLMTYYLKCNT